jgi:hypothetical protein
MTRTPKLPPQAPAVEVWDEQGLVSRIDTRDTEYERAYQIEQLKHTAYLLLQETDWYYIRRADRPSKQVPQAIEDEREAILEAVDSNEQSLLAAATIQEIDTHGWAVEMQALLEQYRPELDGA